MNKKPLSFRVSFPLAALLLLCSVILVGWKENQRLAPVMLVPGLTGKPEYCLTCHSDLPEISSSHPVETFGCVTCHGGEPLALDANLAHSTLRGGVNPSDLSVVQASCGGENCHSGNSSEARDHIQRVETSLQATYAGAITVVRRSFGAQPDDTARFGFYAVQDEPETETGIAALVEFDPGVETSPSILAFAENCLTCHLGAEPPAGMEFSRLTGCAACHTPTAGTNLEQPVHRLTTAIPYTQCNTCHNRGNYSLVDMRFHPRTDQATGRLQDYYQPVAQFSKCEWELDCIDCHTRKEVMGDGDLHSNQKQVEYVRCYTCHGTLDDLPSTRSITGQNDIALRQAFLNNVVDLQIGDKIVVTEKGEPLWNIRENLDGTLTMVSKVTGTKYQIPLVKGSACQQNPDEQSSSDCHVCHAEER